MDIGHSSRGKTFDAGETDPQLESLRREIGKIVIGQETVIEQMLIALVARGHCLLIGVPGLAKTVMAKALADALEMRFARVQFTPDLMPSDITGTNILEENLQAGRKTFRFLPGPVFTNILLADEINRTPPKTQAALLEGMQECSVTIAGDSHGLPEPFYVIATQNPLEQEGTYPLPEAQLDRFMFAVSVRYPTHAEENLIVERTTEEGGQTTDHVLTTAQVRALQTQVLQVTIPPHLVRYAVALARATRPTDASAPDFIRQYVDTGAGPRAGQYLVLAAKSRAVLKGRRIAEFDDIRASAQPVLRHRVFTNFTALSDNVVTDDLIRQLIGVIDVPTDQSHIKHAVTSASDVATGTSLISIPDRLDDVELVRQMKQIMVRVRTEIQQVIVGQHDVVDLVLTALLAGGHCLLVGVPGLAKTTLVKTIADVLDLEFSRIQFTPDLMPSDITGTDIMEVDETGGGRHFRFIRGPVFTNLLLADEINRTPPKTQAALLEAMQELAVTSGGIRYPLRPPFFVLATQNPLEQEGTYPLPEAQLDRFMFNIHLDYPNDVDESVIVDRTTGQSDQKPAKVLDADQIVRLQKLVRRIPVSRHLLTYVTTLVRATRPETKGRPMRIARFVHCGAGPRAGQYLVLAAKARAVMDGRLNVSIADVKAVAIAVLRHRLFTNFSADAEGVAPIDLVNMLLEAVPEPRINTENGVGDQTPATFRCPRCQARLKVVRATEGKNARCQQCGQVFPVNA